MAEILLSLTIIGVVAAITLPSLTGNINERTWNTQRKALYARFSQAIALMPALNGYGTLTEDENHSVTADTAAETFVTEGLSKVLKINNICDADHLADCGVISSITNMTGSPVIMPKSLVALNDKFNFTSSNHDGYIHGYSVIDSKAAAFETQNGESIVVYYNPMCTTDIGVVNNWHYLQQSMCADFVYDLNGSKGPNTVGKDIGFITALYPSDSVVVSIAPVGVRSQVKQYDIGKACTALNPDSRPINYDEGAALFVNKNLIGNIPTDLNTWTSTVATATHAWWISPAMGYREKYNKNTAVYTYCIRRN